MPVPLATALFIFAGFLILASPTAAIVVAGIALAVQGSAFALGGLVNENGDEPERFVAINREFAPQEEDDVAR
jgi:hypothetical protein